MNECSLLSFHCGTWMNWWTPECLQAHQLVHILRVVYYGQPGFMAFLSQGFHGSSQHCFGSWCWADSRKMLLLQDLFPLQWGRRPWRLQQNMLMALFHEFVMLVDSQWLHCRFMISPNAFLLSSDTKRTRPLKLFVFLKLTPTRSELMVKPLMAAWGCWGLSSLLIWASFRLVGEPRELPEKHQIQDLTTIRGADHLVANKWTRVMAFPASQTSDMLDPPPPFVLCS